MKMAFNHPCASILVFCFLVHHSGALINMTYEKVAAPSFPQTLSYRNVLTSAIVRPHRLSCASLCMNKPDCHLYCVQGEICSLFDVVVTQAWPGYSGDNPLTFSICYSLTASSLQTFLDTNSTTLVVNEFTTESDFEATEAPETDSEGTEAPENDSDGTEAPETDSDGTEAPETDSDGTEAPGT